MMASDSILFSSMQLNARVYTIKSSISLDSFWVNILFCCWKIIFMAFSDFFLLFHTEYGLCFCLCHQYSLFPLLAPVFNSCDVLRPYVAHIDDIFKDFTDYKVRVPVTGAIILDETYERVSLFLLLYKNKKSFDLCIPFFFWVIHFLH